MGCSSGSPDGLDRKAVYGKVTLDGTPLARGVISFDPEGGSTGAQPVGGVVTDGSYSIDSAAGPTPGKYKVSIRSASTETPDDANGPGPSSPRKKPAADPIPERYNAKSTLTAEVQASGSTSADFALTSK